METQVKTQDFHAFSPSFNSYTSDDTLTSKAIEKVIHEEHVASRFHESGGVESDNFEFSLVLISDKLEETNLQAWTSFPVFKRDLLLNDEIIPKDGSAHVTSSLRNQFIDDQEESSSYSSSEVDELENNIPSGTFCVWKPKANGASSPVITKCKKSSSTGSTGSKTCKIRYSFRRSNSEGKEPMVLLPPNNYKKIDTAGPKQKQNPVKVSKVAGKLKAPVHELFYLQRRAEIEEGKRKSYLPYRKDLVGLFSNVN